MDKEVRAVLGHHCTATEGSEVVYSRFLQVRALRKLLLKRVRIGLGLDYDPVYGEAFPVTPLQQPRAAPTPTMVEGQVRTPAETVGPVEHAVEYVRDNEEECEAKEEAFDEDTARQAADGVSLFPLSVVSAGMIEIDSSSGSDSSSSSSTSSVWQAIRQPKDSGGYREQVPEGDVFYVHRKSHLVHAAKAGSGSMRCKVKVNENFEELPRLLQVMRPKCLRCFPKAEGRVRNVDQLVGALDEVIRRGRQRAN